MNKRNISVLYKIIVIICLLTGVFISIINTVSVKALLSYYTMRSNIICLISFILFVILEFIKKHYKDNDIYFICKGAITIAILVTGIVYNIALIPMGFKMDVRTSTEIPAIILHSVTPILVILDYIFFDEKGKFKLYYPIFWLIIPSEYIIYVYQYAARGGKFFGLGGSRKFAYFFLDYTKIGYKGVIKWILIFLILILLLSYLLIFIDKKMTKK